MRVGFGYDAHRFGGDNVLMLGGVHIEHDKGLLAHSDGDVVLHAVCDGLLGAAALGDIGRHFPDSDANYKNADSRQLLKSVYAKVLDENYVLGNIDITIVAQQPRLAPYIEDMRHAIADDLGASISQVNVKATTTEKMGFTGRSEGISCYAVVLINV